jgi:hypothetical protein
MKNISNYSNLLEQQLFLDRHEPCQSIDSTPKTNLVMTNLSKGDQGPNKETKTTQTLFSKDSDGSQLLLSGKSNT